MVSTIAVPAEIRQERIALVRIHANPSVMVMMWHERSHKQHIYCNPQKRYARYISDNNPDFKS